MTQRKNDRLLQHDQEKRAIIENVELFRISSSRQRQKEQIAKIQAERNFVNCCHQFVEIEIERDRYSNHYSCESFTQFIEIHTEKRANETK